MSSRNRLHLLLICIVSLAGISPAKIRTWTYTPNGFQPARLPAYSHTIYPTHQSDLSQDGQPGCLRQTSDLGPMQIAPCRGSPDPEMIWQSPTSWQVHQAHWSDFNRDGQMEVALLVWRPFQPWPIDRYLPNPGRISSYQDQNQLSCHLILIGWREGSYRQVWAGSALARPIRAFVPIDLTGDGYPELVALESAYDAPASKPAHALSAWEWNGFGFHLLDRIPGPFQQMVVRRASNGTPLIMTQSPLISP